MFLVLLRPSTCIYPRRGGWLEAAPEIAGFHNTRWRRHCSGHACFSGLWEAPRRACLPGWFIRGTRCRFGGRLVADLGYARVYLYAIVDNAEAVLSTSTENVAAARIYDRPITEAGASQIGAAVIEQYGYNN